MCECDNPAEWRSIPGFSRYEVSNDGHVKHLEAHPKNPKKMPAGGVMSPGWAGAGYSQVHLRDDAGVMRDWYVHQLVAMVFIGPRPDGKEINHIDGIKTHNCVSNVEYCTRRENNIHAIRTGLRPRKISLENADKIRAEYAINKQCHRRIAYRYGVHRSTISNILRNKIYKTA